MEATPHQEPPLYLKTYGRWMKKQNWRVSGCGARRDLVRAVSIISHCVRSRQARHKNGGANLKVPKLPSRSA
jgi:hypothetical protein